MCCVCIYIEKYNENTSDDEREKISGNREFIHNTMSLYRRSRRPRDREDWLEARITIGFFPLLRSAIYKNVRNLTKTSLVFSIIVSINVGRVWFQRRGVRRERAKRSYTGYRFKNSCNCFVMFLYEWPSAPRIRMFLFCVL